MIVADASVLLDALLRTPRGERAVARLFGGDELLHAPHLVDLEIVLVLRRYVLARQLDEARAAEALEDFRDLAVERHAHDVLIPRIWQLRHVLSAYDAAYVALAEVLGAPLVTADARLARARNHDAVVELLR